MDDLLFRLTEALSASTGLAVGAALVWGALSVLLSPCHLGTIPLVVGFVSGGGAGRGRAAALSFSFAGGMLLAIAILGVVVVAAGHAVQGLGAVTNYGIAAIFVLAALHLLGLVPLPARGLTVGRSKGKGLWAAATVGLVLGIGLSPCTFAFLAPILGVTFGSAATRPFFGAVLLLAFGIAHCGVIGLAGSSAEFVQRYLDWNEQSRALTAIKAVCGVLVLLSAGMLVYSA